MKKYLPSLALSLVCACVHLRAQSQQPQSQSPHSQQPSRWSIGLTAGPALPVGAFAGIHNSFAQNKTVPLGGSAELSGAYRIWHFLSAAVVLSGQFNHGNGIPDNLAQVWSYNGETPHSGAFGNDWRMARFMAGSLFTLPLSKHAGAGPTLLLRALAGIQKTKTPAFAYGNPYSVPMYSETLYVPAHDLSRAFAYQLDAGIKWNVSSRCAFLAYAGYDGCRPTITPDVISIPPAELYPGPLTTSNYPSYPKTRLPTGTIYLRTGVAVTL